MKRYCALSVAALLCAACAQDQPKAVFRSTAIDFGKVLQGLPATPEFTVKNVGSAPLKVERINITAPTKVVATKMPAQVLPGAEAVIQLRIDTSKIQGPVDGEITLFLNDPALPEARLSLKGQVVPPVEVSPIPGFFVSVGRGESAESSVEIINHESAALRIDKVEHSAERFKTALETLDPGRRYRLTLFVKGTGPSGHRRDRISVRTSNPAKPEITLMANTLVHERVYASPDRVDFGSVPLGTVKDSLGTVEKLAQRVMVYQKGGKDFQITVTSDLPNLNINAERGPAGDRYQLTVKLRPEKTERGQIKGSLIIQTNDQEFPKITVLVSGMILQ